VKALLERWAKLEPERCQTSDGAVHLGQGFAFMVHWPMLTADPVKVAVIFGATVEAIKARGWDWSVGNTLNRPYSGHIVKPRFTYVQKASTPAEALLTAYLEALEAENHTDSASVRDGSAT
jgi:hypothetical protein